MFSHRILMNIHVNVSSVGRKSMVFPSNKVYLHYSASMRIFSKSENIEAFVLHKYVAEGLNGPKILNFD